MRIRALALALVCSCSGVSAAQDRPPLRFEPTSNWVLDYADERCSLNRSFAAGDNLLKLRLDSYGSPVVYRMLLVGRNVPKTNKLEEQIQLRLTPDVAPLPYHTLNGTLDKTPATSFGLAFRTSTNFIDVRKLSPSELEEYSRHLHQIDVDFERKTDGFELQFWNRQTIQVALGNMGEPLRAMRDCLSNLQKSWGLDPAREASLSRQARPKPMTLRSVQRRYPATMLLSGTNAYVPVRVMVGADGNATSCVVQVPSVDRSFKDAVCAGLTGAYEPALDQAGQPVASVYQNSVIYRIFGG
jgi:hypothetical protein